MTFCLHTYLDTPEVVVNVIYVKTREPGVLMHHVLGLSAPSLREGLL